jgi:hypothetical protein
MLQRVNFEKDMRIEFAQADAATAMRWVEELEAGDWMYASISHCVKLVRRLAHLARELEVRDGEAAAKTLWSCKRRAEKIQRKVEIRESNTLPDKYSYTEVGDVMEHHAALTGARGDRGSDDDV